jgi:hypothetical protein
VGEDDFRSQPTARQIPQRGQERVEQRAYPRAPGGRPSSMLRR